jgi:hypothetical protein
MDRRSDPARGETVTLIQQHTGQSKRTSAHHENFPQNSPRNKKRTFATCHDDGQEEYGRPEKTDGELNKDGIPEPVPNGTEQRIASVADCGNDDGKIPYTHSFTIEPLFGQRNKTGGDQ